MSPKESALTLAALREVLRYEFDTGRFLWVSAAGGVTVGVVAGNVNTNGYWVVGINGQKYRKHGGYMASVSINKKKKRRGPYRTIDRAQTAYIELKRKFHEGCTL